MKKKKMSNIEILAEVLKPLGAVRMSKKRAKESLKEYQRLVNEES